MYNVRFKFYIKPYLGENKMQEITPAIVDEFMRKLTKKGYSRNILSNTLALLSQTLETVFIKV